MKRIFASTAVWAGVTSLAATVFLGFTATAWGQAPKASSVPHKVGLIDMAEIFKEYKKFEALREDLKAEITQTKQEEEQITRRITNLQKQLKQSNPAGADYAKFEKELLGANSELQAFRNSVKRTLLKKESQIYKTIYLEVTDVVRLYTKQFGYTLILRFNRQSLAEADQPAMIIQQMNQLVVDYRKEDDITDSVLDYLNRQYSDRRKTPSPSRTGDRTPAGGTRKR